MSDQFDLFPAAPRATPITVTHREQMNQRVLALYMSGQNCEEIAAATGLPETRVIHEVNIGLNAISPERVWHRGRLKRRDRLP